MRRFVCLALGLLSFGLIGCSTSDESEVSLASGHRFEPETITVEVGTTVTWVSNSDDAHTVTAYEESIPDAASYFSSGGFASEEEARDDLPGALLKSGDTYEVTFERPGTYAYFCIPHESDGMKATVIVQE